MKPNDYGIAIYNRSGTIIQDLDDYYGYAGLVVVFNEIRRMKLPKKFNKQIDRYSEMFHGVMVMPPIPMANGIYALQFKYLNPSTRDEFYEWVKIDEFIGSLIKSGIVLPNNNWKLE